ncbi:MAG: helix-turn-helix transcriptional regulator [Chloroflexi bacterium]|nr:helix-turn-helix transcriptional regulator [Chloroflexota bacterium]
MLKPGTHNPGDFSLNLRLLCSRHPSISELCRQIGLNRQQFGKYLNGSTLPSAHNLRRVCAHFDIDERELFEPHEVFRARHGVVASDPRNLPWKALFQAFPGDRVLLRRYLGLYHSHFVSPSWPGTIMRALVLMYEREGFVMSRTVERAVDPERGVRQRSKYEGLVSFRGERLFVVEREALFRDSIVETILFPAHRHQLTYLRGMTFGVSWRPRRAPYASRSIWKRLRDGTDARAALRSCGVFALDNRALDPVVMGFVGNDTFPSGEDLQGGEFF